VRNLSPHNTDEENMITIRTMQLSDIPGIMAIQAICYTEINPETENSMRAKLLASPATCFVAILENTLAGYLISLPWEFANPPALNAEQCALPENPDCLYLHDLAIAPHARSAGGAPALVNRFLEQLPILKLQRASLIAIQNSAAYWQRYGFKAAALSDELRTRLSSYGNNVEYMEHLIFLPGNRNFIQGKYYV
jgi:predicted N-acetyltransferase YhbS